MKKNKLFNKKVIQVLFSVLICTSVYAENQKVKELVNPEYYNKLVEKGNVSFYRDNGSNEMLLLPENKYSEKIKNSMIEKENKKYPFTYEGLYLINKQDIISKNNSTKTDINIDDVSVVCRSVSKMQGMEYYSSTKKKVCVLYKKAYMIADENSEDPIPDENTGNADGQVSYCLQDDNSFGVNKYKLSYFQSDDSMLAQFNILDIMGLGPFKAIYPGKMIISILIIDCGEDLLLYLSTDLESVKYPGIKGQITDSMTSRMEAVYKWFLNQF